MPKNILKYSIKEIYYTLQGEGAQSGRPAIFCRFAGCNLWSGREIDRKTAICQFCDTDFWGTDGENGGKYSLEELVSILEKVWPTDQKHHFVVFTGGEPALQLDDQLVHRLNQSGFQIAIETNGTLPLPQNIDWVCVSPKAHTEWVVKAGDELKLVFPQEGLTPEEFSQWDFKHFYLQPLHDSNIHDHTQKCIEYCLQYPQWKLSLQSHKLIGLK